MVVLLLPLLLLSPLWLLPPPLVLLLNFILVPLVLQSYPFWALVGSSCIDAF